MIIIKQPVRIKKERRQRTPVAEGTTPEAVAEAKTEEIEEKKEQKKTEEKPKVELKDIEQKLDELLGE